MSISEPAAARKFMRVDEFATELGVSTRQLLAACAELGFPAVDGGSAIDVVALKRAVKENAARKTTAAPSAAPVHAPKFCPQCGKPAEGTKFCITCGFRFAPVTTPQPSERVTPARPVTATASDRAKSVRAPNVKHVCPYCQSDDDDVLFGSCPSCATVLHRDCWADNGGCPMPGCASGPK